MNIALLLERIAAQDPRRPAVYLGVRAVMDYGQLRDRVARLAAGFRSRGLRAGDRVAICMPNSVDYLVAMQAALWARLVMVPINAKLHPREVDFIATHAGARLLIAEDPEIVAQPVHDGARIAAADVDKLAAGMEPLAVCAAGPDDLAWLFYTSGTTGRPKGVMLTHRNLMAMTLCYLGDVTHVEAADAVVYAAPMSHGAGLYSFAYISAGARHVLPESGGFDAGELLDLAAELKRVSLFAAPTMVGRLVDHAVREGLTGDGLKTIVYGGGPMYVADIRRARAALGSRFVQIYGQGESPMTITVLSREVIEDDAHPQWLERLASVGVRQSAVEVRVVSESGGPVPTGGIGEIVVRSDTVMQGYWNDPQATTATLRGGWLYTGDLGVLDEAGFLTLKDRSKDLIISGGSNIYPREVEEVLLEHPAVREAAVIGVPDAEWGECVVAYVVAQAGYVDLAAELDALCLQRIARFKRPKHYVAVESLPKNNYGKVLKTKLRRTGSGKT